MNSYKILIIDDNQSVLRTLKLVLNGVFKTVVTVPDPQLMPALLQAGDVDVVLLDKYFVRIHERCLNKCSNKYMLSSKSSKEGGLL